MFGEVYDSNPEFMSRYTTEGTLQATIDFGFQSRAVDFAAGEPTTGMRDLYAGDDYYTDADSNAYQLLSFLGNHDMGRVGKFLADRGATGRELLDRDVLNPPWVRPRWLDVPGAQERLARLREGASVRDLYEGEGSDEDRILGQRGGH